MPGQSRIGVFGGTFDPIHIGHLAAASEAVSQLALHQMWFVPNAEPPHKRNSLVSAAADRVEMVRLAIADDPRFELSLIEVERGGASYTLDTLRQLKSSLPRNAEMLFLAGWEALEQLHTWHEPEAILAEFQMVLMDRPTEKPVDWAAVEARFPGIRDHVRVIHVPRLEIRARDIRDRVRSGKPIRYYVPAPVEAYIRNRALYRA